MNMFADRMRLLTEHLAGSIRDREESLTRVHEATDGVLTSARSFMNGVAKEHQEMSEELRETLEANRAARCQNVAELRHRHQEALEKARTELRRTLGEARSTRLNAVSQLKHGFHTEQRALASDLKAAAGLWHAFVGRTPVGEFAVEEFVIKEPPAANGHHARQTAGRKPGRKPGRKRGRPRSTEKSKAVHAVHAKRRSK